MAATRGSATYNDPAGRGRDPTAATRNGATRNGATRNGPDQTGAARSGP
jgi:hypothetical protein